MGALSSSERAHVQKENQVLLDTPLAPVEALVFGPEDSELPTVLAIHGVSNVPAVTQEWQQTAVALAAKGYRVIVPNLHSNARTRPALLFGGISDQDFAVFVDSLVPSKFILAGAAL